MVSAGKNAARLRNVSSMSDTDSALNVKSGGVSRLVSTNDKTIKLWRISERNVYEPVSSVAEAYMNTKGKSR